MSKSDLKSTKTVTERVNMEDSNEVVREDVKVLDEAQELKVSEDKPTESQTEKTSEEKKEESELALLTKQVDELKNENSRTKNSMQKRIDELTWKQKSQEESREKSKDKTWEDLSVDELKQHRTRYREEGNDAMIDMISDLMADKRIAKGVTQSRNETQNDAVRVQSWDAVIAEYPELSDVNSEHYKRTAEMVQSDKRFDDINSFPEGHAVAARLAAERILKDRINSAQKKSREAEKKLTDEKSKNSLGSSTAKADTTSSTTKDKLLAAAEDSGSPHSPEWRAYLKHVNSARK